MLFRKRQQREKKEGEAKFNGIERKEENIGNMLCIAAVSYNGV
jgi:hypothetical protein